MQNPALKTYASLRLNITVTVTSISIKRHNLFILFSSNCVVYECCPCAVLVKLYFCFRFVCVYIMDLYLVQSVIMESSVDESESPLFPVLYPYTLRHDLQYEPTALCVTTRTNWSEEAEEAQIGQSYLLGTMDCTWPMTFAVETTSITTNLDTRVTRQKCIQRYRDKRSQRKCTKPYVYHCRRNFARTRKRKHGRFV